MKVYLGVDHQGLKCRDEIIKYVSENGFDIVLVSKDNYDTDDYPDYAYKVCKEVIENNGLGILVCGTGIGMSIAANKVKGIRCAHVESSNDAFLAKNHNGANVIAFSCNLDINVIYDIIDIFLTTKDACEERHLRRIDKIKQIEEGTYE